MSYQDDYNEAVLSCLSMIANQIENLINPGYGISEFSKNFGVEMESARYSVRQIQKLKDTPDE